MLVQSLLSYIYLTNVLDANAKMFLTTNKMILEPDQKVGLDIINSTLAPKRREELSNLYKSLTDVRSDAAITRYFNENDIESKLYNNLKSGNFIIFDKNIKYTKLPNIPEMFNNIYPPAVQRNAPDMNKVLRDLVILQAKQRIDSTISGTGWVIKDRNEFFSKVIANNALLEWEYLNRGFGVVFSESIDTDGYPKRQLVTRSPEIIGQLNKLGLLEQGTNITEEIKRLNPKSDKDNLLNGMATVLRLDWQPTAKVYKLSKMAKVVLDKIIPLPALEALSTYICVIAGLKNLPTDSGFIEVRYKSSDNTIKFVKVTSSVSVVKSCYNAVIHSNEEAAAVLKKKVNEALIGLDVNTLECHLFNLEASVYGQVTKALRPGRLMGIQDGDLRTVDVSAHDVDFTLLRRVFFTKINKLNKAQLMSLNVMIPFTAQTVRGMKLQALMWQTGLTGMELYKNLTMPQSAISAIFGNDVKAALANRKNYIPRYLKVFKSLDLNAVKEQAAKSGTSVESVLDNYIKSGVLHAMVMDSHGKLRDTYITKNERILQYEYGTDYIAVYGARRERLRACKKELETFDKDVDVILSTLSDYGLDDFPVWKIYEAHAEDFANIVKGVKQEGIAFIIKLIDEEISALSANDGDKIAMVRGKKVNAYRIVHNGEANIYDSFGVSNIKSLEYSTLD